jgi:hypothetical protein
MRKFLTVFLAATLFLSGCSSWSSSRANPGNWFGGSRTAPTDAQAQAEFSGAEINPLIPTTGRGIFAKAEKPDLSVLIDTVTELRIDREPGGAIVYATGVASRQGAYGAELRLAPQDGPPKDGILNFSFRVLYPQAATPVGNERTRTVIDAYSLTSQQLTGVRAIRVTAARNSRESRRR